MLKFEKVKLKSKAPPNNERANKIYKTKERKLEIEKRLLITKLNQKIKEFDDNLVELIYERMIIMEIVKILEMKQILL